MKVYIVITKNVTGGEDNIHGVFSSLEKAQKVCKEINYSVNRDYYIDTAEIEEYTLDVRVTQ